MSFESSRFNSQNRREHRHASSKENLMATRLALRPIEAARALGISLRYLSQLRQDGKIPAITLGGGKRPVILYPVNALQAWLSREVQSDNDAPQ